MKVYVKLKTWVEALILIKWSNHVVALSFFVPQFGYYYSYFDPLWNLKVLKLRFWYFLFFLTLNMKQALFSLNIDSFCSSYYMFWTIVLFFPVNKAFRCCLWKNESVVDFEVNSYKHCDVSSLGAKKFKHSKIKQSWNFSFRAGCKAATNFFKE